jgi:D-serine deaminase-like pyridoxal phosphate-dependent protein
MMERSASKELYGYAITNPQEVMSPALLIYPALIKSNILKMIDIAGSVNRLRPHVKTHKMAGVVKMMMEAGIFKFKSATISETEMAARCGASDILLAMQPAGPNMERFFRLKKKFGDTKFSCIVDSVEVINRLSDMASQTGIETRVWVDINNGMNRSGIQPGKDAEQLLLKAADARAIKLEGLHVYDGHILDGDISKREKSCTDAFAPVLKLIETFRERVGKELKVVAGGTSTFPIHASRGDVECSPGTPVLWDYGYGSSFPDLNFFHAAVLFTRIVSKPAPGLVCLDLGHKAVASEMPHPRVFFPGLGNYDFLTHSEEHMVIRTGEADGLEIGDILYGIPRHICPTVDRFDSVYIVDNRQVTGQWEVTARKRTLTI